MDIKQFQSSFQLLSESVTDLRVSNSFSDYDERRSAEKHIDVSYCIVQVKKSQKTGFSGTLDLKLAISSEADGNSFSLSMTLRGVFAAPLKLGEEEFRRMMRINGCAALYGIARASVGCISTQFFTVGNIVLPLANFIRFRELDAGERDNDP